MVRQVRCRARVLPFGGPRRGALLGLRLGQVELRPQLTHAGARRLDERAERLGLDLLEALKLDIVGREHLGRQTLLLHVRQRRPLRLWDLQLGMQLVDVDHAVGEDVVALLLLFHERLQGGLGGGNGGARHVRLRLRLLHLVAQRRAQRIRLGMQLLQRLQPSILLVDERVELRLQPAEEGEGEAAGLVARGLGRRHGRARRGALVAVQLHPSGRELLLLGLALLEPLSLERVGGLDGAGKRAQHGYEGRRFIRRDSAHVSAQSRAERLQLLTLGRNLGLHRVDLVLLTLDGARDDFVERGDEIVHHRLLLSVGHARVRP